MRKLKLLAIAAFAVGLITSAQPANAFGCNGNCQQKCKAPGNQMTYSECVAFWSYMNVHYGKTAKQFEGERWSADACRHKCGVMWHRLGYANADACVGTIPCSKY